MSSRWLDSALPPLGARPPASQRLIAVPYRHAGLIAVFALAGAFAASAPALLHARPRPVAAATRGPASRSGADAAAAMGLRLDIEPGFGIAADDAPPESEGLRLADAPHAPPLQLDEARALDEIDFALLEAPPAAGLVAAQVLSRAPLADDRPWRLGSSGIAGGLLLGLLAAALRELRGQRMRSPREAEWALGAPVLAAIPTLSVRARAALLARPDRA